MEIIRNYLESMFAQLPNTPEVVKAKQELRQMMEDKYSELIAEGKADNEAIGIGIVLCIVSIIPVCVAGTFNVSKVPQEIAASMIFFLTFHWWSTCILLGSIYHFTDLFSFRNPSSGHDGKTDSRTEMTVPEDIGEFHSIDCDIDIGSIEVGGTDYGRQYQAAGSSGKTITVSTDTGEIEIG